MTSIVLPLHIEFEEWAAQIRIDLPGVSFPNPSKVKDWRGWAAQVVNGNLLTNVPLPTEIIYPKEEDWKKWAAYFVNNMYNSSTFT